MTAQMTFLGLTVYAYGLHLAAGCLAAGLLLWHLAGKEEARRNAAALTCLLSPLLGLVAARLVYVLSDITFAPFLTLRNVLNLRLGGYAMFGALLGAVLGGLLAARIAGVKKAAWLDTLAPALFAFIAVARLGEGHTVLGISRPLVTGVLDNTFLAMRDDYDAYLRTYLLESAGALVLCLLSLRSLRRHGAQPGRTALFAGLTFGVTQTLFESLRFDQHIRFSFIGLQQVLSVVLFSLIIICLAVYLLRRGQAKALAIWSLCLLPVVLGGILGLEFMVDRSQVSKWLTYGLYVLLLCVPIALGVRLLERNGYHG